MRLKNETAGEKSMAKRKRIRAVQTFFVAGMVILLACLFDYRYAMNDDVFIHAIISGRYSGTPDVHNIQIILLLNGVFVLLYRICSFVPWFGIFMVSAQFFSFYGIVMCLEKSLNGEAAAGVKGVERDTADSGAEGDGMPKKSAFPAWRFVLPVAGGLLLMGLMLQEMLMIQYTYTAALVLTSATLRLYCAREEGLSARRSFWRHFGILAQFLLAFCLRTEIFLFLLPFSALLTVIRYHKDNGFRMVGRELKCFGLFWGVLLFCVLGLYGADRIGYAGQDWGEYRKVFEYRTRLYDFLALPEYGENQEFYEEAGISRVQYELLKNYNFSLDERITGDTLKKVVEYADEKRISQYRGAEKLYMKMFTLPFREGLWTYSHRALFDPKVAGDDYPWNFVCAALYLVLLFLTCFTKKVRNIVYMLLLFSGRSALWMYLILGQRTPTRVTHSLFVIEIACLLTLVFEELKLLGKTGGPRRTGWLYAGISALFLCGAGAVMINGWGSVSCFYRETVEFNREWRELLDYCGSQEDCFFFLDVYSTVNYSEEIFGGGYDRTDNYDICGGWLAKSPLCTEKYEKFGFSSPREALIYRDNVFFVAQRECDLEWLTELYAEYGIRVEPEYREEVAGQFDIIKLRIVE